MLPAFRFEIAVKTEIQHKIGNGRRGGFNLVCILLRKIFPADKFKQRVGRVGVADENIRFDAQALFGFNRNGASFLNFNFIDGLMIENLAAIFFDCFFDGAAHRHAAAFGIIGSVQVITDPRKNIRGGVELRGWQAVITPECGEHGFELLILCELAHEFIPTLRHGRQHFGIDSGHLLDGRALTDLAIRAKAADLKKCFDHLGDQCADVFFFNGEVANQFRFVFNHIRRCGDFVVGEAHRVKRIHAVKVDSIQHA